MSFTFILVKSTCLVSNRTQAHRMNTSIHMLIRNHILRLYMMFHIRFYNFNENLRLLSTI